MACQCLCGGYPYLRCLLLAPLLRSFPELRTNDGTLLDTYSSGSTSSIEMSRFGMTAWAADCLDLKATRPSHTSFSILGGPKGRTSALTRTSIFLRSLLPQRRLYFAAVVQSSPRIGNREVSCFEVLSLCAIMPLDMI